MSARVRLFGALGAALAIAALAGCAAPSSPTPAAPPASTESAPPRTGALPPRPRDVSFTGVDPCSLITPQLRAELYDLNEHFSHEKNLDSHASTDCTVTNVPNKPSYVLTLRLVTDVGAQQEMSMNLNPVTVTNIGGFGAVQQPGLNDVNAASSCLIVIDTAPGQSLWVGLGSAEVTPPPGGSQAVCAKTRPAAESILQQLLAKSS